MGFTAHQAQTPATYSKLAYLFHCLPLSMNCCHSICLHFPNQNISSSPLETIKSWPRHSRPCIQIHPIFLSLPSPAYTFTFCSEYTGTLKLCSFLLPLFYQAPVISLTSQEVILATFMQYLMHTPYISFFK